jgi:hypothetical protein
MQVYSPPSVPMLTSQQAFVRSLKEEPDQTFEGLLKVVRRRLRDKYAQKPQLSASYRIVSNVRLDFHLKLTMSISPCRKSLSSDRTYLCWTGSGQITDRTLPMSQCLSCIVSCSVVYSLLECMFEYQLYIIVKLQVQLARG